MGSPSIRVRVSVSVRVRVGDIEWGFLPSFPLRDFFFLDRGCLGINISVLALYHRNRREEICSQWIFYKRTANRQVGLGLGLG